jgi:DNA primase
MNSDIDQVLERVNILDVISQYVKLRKTGKNFIGLCPFHQEKTPSFTVSVEKQIYYCFGCHEGGNAINFLAKYEHSTFFEALENLASQVGIELSRRGGTPRKPILDALTRLSEYYQETLSRSRSALKYLNDREIDSETIAQFKLGFSERRTYGKDFAKRLGAPLDILFSAGIMKLRDSGEMYDIFRGRIVIPIPNVNGRVIGFGGRAIEKGVLPKYINSPESAVFAKRSVVYGLDRAKHDVAKQDHALVVEGYFDLISLHKAGIVNAVASLGTAITEEQISRLRNFTENITLVLDGDEAGIKSALRLISLFGGMDVNGNMVILPDNHDPDSFIREQGTKAFAALVEERKPLLDRLVEASAKQRDLKTLEGRLHLIMSILPHIENINDSLRRRLYVQRLSELTGVEEGLFWDRLSEKSKSPKDDSSGGRDTESIVEKSLIGILLNNPEFIEDLAEKGVENQVKDVHLRKLLSLIFDHYHKNGDLNLNVFLSSLEDPELRKKAMSAVMNGTEHDRQETAKLISDYVYHTEKVLMREEAKDITQRLLEAERKGDEKSLRELLERKKRVATAMKYKSAK